MRLPHPDHQHEEHSSESSAESSEAEHDLENFTEEQKEVYEQQQIDKAERLKIRRARKQQWGLNARPFFPLIPKFEHKMQLYDHFGPFMIPYRHGAFLWEFEVMIFKIVTVLVCVYVYNFNDRYCALHVATSPHFCLSSFRVFLVMFCCF